MRELKHFLKRFATLSVRTSQVAQTLAVVVYEELNIRLEPKDIRVNGDVAYFNVPSVVKSELLLNRARLIRAFQGRGGASSSLRDIR